MSDLLADLARPEAYPAPRPTAVRLVTTHISWVFITDHDVWKLKRPVDYGFLDYTTLDRRRHFCHEEVRVNGRLAPGVYLGVVPVHLDHGRHSFTANGTVVDYAVRMRRLPDTASAESLLGRAQLTHEHLARLAGRLAAFYATVAPASGGGSAGVLRANVEENFAQVRPFIGRFVEPETFEAVRAWQLGCLERDARVFETRQEQGRIRDGHGDLRLEHVYFEGDEPLVIDAIEFNERFRVADVAADVAFLAMELDARSRPELAASFLAAVARECEDYDLYAVVDFYLSYRAWVRGKVAGFLAADPATAPEKAQRKSREAGRLFALARTYTEPRAGLGAVVAVGGLIGAGKSTLAHALGRSLRVPVIDSDRTRKSLAGVPATQPAPAEVYTEAFTRRTFDEVFRRAGAVLGSGRGVILDATFRGRDLRRRARELAIRHGRPFLFVEAVCEEATLRARLRARAAAGPSVSDATEALLERFRREFEPVTELPAGEHVVVDTTRPLASQIQAVRARWPTMVDDADTEKEDPT
ncbi:MAG TPA: AAA family ATPase [Candidatus Limnocylindria bacterium]|nr:AAA family ATPase [Candidatus Limnocylindria bacterium]